MTNPLTSREAPDPMTLTGFSPKAQQEMKNNEFAARTGGLVNCSASTYWELAYAARAWHEHLKSTLPDQRKAREQKAGGTESARILQGARDVTDPSETSKES